MYSTANLRVFQSNYQEAKRFLGYLEEEFNFTDTQLLAKFNLQTYVNVLVVEASEQYILDLERQFDTTTNQLKPLAWITLEHALRVIQDGVFLEEVGDR